MPLGTQYCTLTTYITAAPGTDTACIGFTVHEQDVTMGLPPLRCCMIDACFALPDCPCDPDVTYATLSAGQLGDDTCCWDIALHQMPGTVSSVQTNILTPGVSFDAVAPTSAWDFAIVSGQSLVWTPDAGGTLPAALALPTLCLDVPAGSASPQVLEIVWVASDGDTCRQGLEFNCAAGDPCATVDSVQLVCGQPPPSNNLYTIAVTNHSPYVVSHVGVAYASPAGSVLNEVFNVGALAPGATTNITIPLIGGPAGTQVCFRLNLYRETGPNTYEACCVTEEEHCITLKFCGLPTGPQLVALYPNPARGRVTLDFGAAGSRAPMQACVRDIAGKRVYEEDIPAGSARHTMEMPGLAPGLYLVELVENGLRVWVKKVSVIR